MLEEFKRSVPTEVRTHLDEQKSLEVSKAAAMADDYSLTHKSVLSKPKPKFGANNYTPKFHENKQSQQNKKAEDKKSHSNSKFNKNSDLTCQYCKRPGHVKQNCWTWIGKQIAQPKSPNSVANMSTGPEGNKVNPGYPRTKPKLQNYDKVKDKFLPFMSEGHVSLIGDNKSTQRSITILRDTGSDHSVILENAMQFSDSSFTGETINVEGIECNPITIPLH